MYLPSTARSSFYLIFFLVFSLTLGGQPVIPEGVELVPELSEKQLNYSKEGLGRVTTFSNKDGERVFRFITETRPENIYSLSRKVPLRKMAMREGQTLLLSFEAKTFSATLETGEGKLLCQIKQSESYKDNLRRTVSIGSGWRRYTFPFTLTKDIPAGELALVVQFGYPKQEVRLREISLLAFGEEVTAADLPSTKLTYRGREADAAWRLEAAKRIERHRKGSFSLAFVDGAGKPVRDVPVKIELERHHFGWGAAVSAEKIKREPQRLDHISRAFNRVVFENDLKIKRWGNPAHQLTTLWAIDQLQAHGIAVKGHVLIWPGFRHLPPRVRQIADDPDQVVQLMEDHLRDILDQTSGKISHWDVVNEAYSNRDLQEITGSEEILYEGFRMTAKAAPGVGRYTNEFGIISRGGHDQTKQQWYYDYINRLDEATGGLVDGIGIQCHMGSDLTPPERVLELLDFYGELNKAISVSEFTIDLDDPELRFDYTRDFLTVAFSHPSVREFLFWGHYAPTHPKAAIYDKDWQPADMGQAFFSLVHGLWKTKLEAKADAGGRVQGRGFYGTYRFRYSVGDEEREGRFELSPGEAVLLEVKLD